MVVLAEKVVGNWFEADRISTVTYKVYAARPSNDDTILAQMVEAAMRYDDPSCLVSTSGRELWVFSLDENPPAPPSQFKMNVVSSGTLQPEYFSIEEHLPRPWPLLTAIEGRCIAYLGQTSPVLQPFGKTSLISTADGSLLHIKASINCSGELNLRLTTENANLLPVQGKECKAVWLVPSGKQALLVDASSVPSPMMARHFLSVVQKVMHFTFDADELDESPWVRVALDGRDFMWPAALVVAIGGGGGSGGLNWLMRPDEFSTLSESMQAMRDALAAAREHTATPTRAESAPEDAFSPGTRSFLRQSVFRARHSSATSASVAPPPPTPSASTLEVTTAPISIAAAAARVAASEVPPDSILAAEVPIYPTPGDPSPVRDWSPTSERWEEEDITVADFNFYDAPLEADEIKEGTDALPDAEVVEVDEVPVEIEEDWSEEPGKSAFSALRFPKNGVDAKYAEGGRYFTVVKDEESGGEDVAMADAELPGDLPDEGDDLDGDDDDDDEEDDGTEEVAGAMYDSGNEEAGGHPGLSRREFTEISSEVSEAWITALTCQPGIVSADSVSTDDLQFLMAQVVFDGSGLQSLVNLAPNMGTLEPISEANRTRLREIYPNLRAVTLAEASGYAPPAADERAGSLMVDSDASGAGTPAAPWMTPRGARSGSVQTSRTHSPDPGAERPKAESFTLLSPPLYAVKRGDQPHKARASILRFWRTFGLQPNPEPRDVRLILLTLASPRVVSQARASIRALKDLYQGCHLGKMELLSFGSVVNGVLNIATDLEYTSPDAVGDLFETSCSYLKRQLQELDSEAKVVIAMAFPPGPRTSPLPLARGFRAIRATYPQIRWMLHSIESFASREGAEVPTSQYQLMRIALLLYDRWVPHTTIPYGGPRYMPAFSLARLAPHSISIKFQPRPPAQILDDDPMMHVAYAITPDRRWVAVAWSDQWANVTKIEVLRLAGLLRTRASSPVLGLSSVDPTNPAAGPTGEPHADRSLRNLDSVFSDIWRRTGQMCASVRDSPRNARWAVSIVKCGPMDAAEVGIWRRVADVRWEQQIQLAFPYLLHLPQARPLNVPGGEVLFPHVSMATSESKAAVATQPGTPTTPATPGTPAPSSETRNDNVIVAALDETHGIAFKNPPQTWGVTAAPLITGVLVKPLVPAAFRGHQQLEIVLVYAQSQQPTNIMKQVLGQYRRLASLAEYNGVSAGLTIMPWHVHAANKMVAALSVL